MAMSKPEGFGPHWWEFIHTAAAGAKTPEKRKEFKRFMTITVPTLLPCDACSIHIVQNMKKYDIDKYMGSEEQLLLWTYLIHGVVNEMLGKPSQPTYHEVKLKYLPSPGMVCREVCSVDGDETPHSSGTHKQINTPTQRKIQKFRYR